MRSTLLLVALICAITLSATSTQSSTAASQPRLHLDVRVDISEANSAQADIAHTLIGAGFEVELAVPELGRWQGWLPLDRLDELESLDAVQAIVQPTYGHFATGAALTEGDEALNAATARSAFDVDGSGIRVAVISDGIGGLERAQVTGEAPLLVEARAFGAGRLNRGQEGTAMIEIVHDLAPGAAISFGAVSTDLDLIAAVNYFARRVDIIVDDVSFTFPADQQSDVSRNTTAALEHPDWPLRLYVTAAGNWAESHWSGQWREGPDGKQVGLLAPGRIHRFVDSGEADTWFGAGNRISVGPGDEFRLALLWDDPWGRSTNDYNLFLLSTEGEVVASSMIPQGIGAHTHVPREHLQYKHVGLPTDLFIVIQNHNNDAEPVDFHLFAFPVTGQQPRFTFQQSGGSLLAQSDAEGALTVGAVNVGRDSVAPYSSRGPTLNGVLKPEIVAVDRVTVSATTDFAPRFLGSSAAAPHVAGVGALLLEAQPALLAADGGSPILERRLIRDILTGTAKDILPLGHDLASGSGLIDAFAAINYATSQIAVVNSTDDRGAGTLRQAIRSGASILLLQRPNGNNQRTITLESLLPTVNSGQIIDGEGWTIDASAVDIGLRIADDAELWGISVDGAQDAGILVSGDDAHVVNASANANAVGIRITGASATIEGTAVSRSGSHGIVVADGGSATITASTIETNAGAGVRIHPAAGDVRIGQSLANPTAIRRQELTIPIGVLDSPAPLPRTGQSHVIVGTVSIDGLPAPAGTPVDMYLDRRLTASVTVDRTSSFVATATGPGTELRFAVAGVPLDQRIAFQAGRTTSTTLRAVSPETKLGLDRPEHRPDGANLFRNNLIGVEIMPVELGQVGGRGVRWVWANVMQRNRINISSTVARPTIDEARWTPSGLQLSGSAPGAGIVHLYAGDASVRYVADRTRAFRGLFSFRNIDVDPNASAFTVIAQDALLRGSSESAVVRTAPVGTITSVRPNSGYIGGGEYVQICGDGIATTTVAPTVWFGGQTAEVRFWSAECVTIETPSAAAGFVDIALHLADTRPVVAINGFVYRSHRVVPLKRGWNLVTWFGGNERATVAFSTLAGSTFRAYAWEPNDQKWFIFATDLPARLNTLSTIKRNQPLWIFLESADVNWRQLAPD